MYLFYKENVFSLLPKNVQWLTNWETDTLHYYSAHKVTDFAPLYAKDVYAKLARSK